MADSNITKRALAASLKELMMEQPFDKINVTQICERCNMNRKSFYYHFKDKYDLVNWIFDTEFIALLKDENLSSNYKERWAFIEKTCRYFYQNHAFYRKALQIKCQNAYQPVRALSGGNKQKVVFGKWCADDADVLILDCPTRGVDIGVKAAMYQLIYDMKKQGKSIIMISEELPELMGMCDRLLIMRDGAVSGEFYRKDGYNDRELIERMI